MWRIPFPFPDENRFPARDIRAPAAPARPELHAGNIARNPPSGTCFSPSAGDGARSLPAEGDDECTSREFLRGFRFWMPERACGHAARNCSQPYAKTPASRGKISLAPRAKQDYILSLLIGTLFFSKAKYAVHFCRRNDKLSGTGTRPPLLRRIPRRTHPANSRVRRKIQNHAHLRRRLAE